MPSSELRDRTRRCGALRLPHPTRAVSDSDFNYICYVLLKPQNCSCEISRSIASQCSEHQAGRINSGLFENQARTSGPFARENRPVDRCAIAGVAACHKCAISALLESRKNVGWVNGPGAGDYYRNQILADLESSSHHLALLALALWPPSGIPRRKCRTSCSSRGQLPPFS
jgi:hypothetical protein